MTESKSRPVTVETVVEDPSPPSSASHPVRVASAAALVIAVMGWAYAPVFHWLWRAWMDDPNYSHGLLVIPVAGLILWNRLRPPKELPTVPWGAALVLLVVVLAARAFFYERGNQWAEAMTLLPVLGCLALLFGGRDLLIRSWPAIGFLMFMIPLPRALSGLLAGPLQSLATLASSAVLKLSGLWVVVEGNIIFVGKQPLEVETACNGLSMLMCLSATVVAAVLLVPMAAWLRWVLLLSAPPIALASNVLRIVATAWCYHWFGPKVGGQLAHDGAGWLMMPTAVVLVGLELWLINRLVVVENVVVEPMILGRPLPGPRDVASPKSVAAEPDRPA